MTTFNEAAHRHADAIAELIVRKQRDYGPANIMRNHVPPELALCVRLSDKIARLVNLAGKGLDPGNEALQDTWSDIVGYGLIGMMVLNGEFELPLEEPLHPATDAPPMAGDYYGAWKAEAWRADG